MSTQVASHPCLHVLAAHSLYVHSMPGRLRLELPALLENPPQAAKLERALKQTRGVRGVVASPVTARVLVQYDPRQTSLGQIMQTMQDTRSLPGCLQGGACSHGHNAFHGVLGAAAQEVLMMGMQLALGF